MPIKRRNFVRGLLIAHTIPAAVIAEQSQSPPAAPQQQPPPQPNTPARQVPRQPQNVPQLETIEIDLTAETSPRYFSALQFATLNKLAELLVPPAKGNPGALDAKAPEFLDFLISVSPADRQQIYRHGLDALNEQATKEFSKSFSELDAKQADAILRPLLVARPWPQDLPSDPVRSFVAQVHEDLRTATTNSREWAEAAAKSGHHFTRGYQGSGFYWAPIDPISEG